jgi:predicted MFS family arabinose efflux permease
MGVQIDLLLIGLLVGTCLSNSVYSVIAPFFPTVAYVNGLSEKEVGIIFSSYPIAATAVSPIYTYMLMNIGRKKVLIFASV